MMPGLGHSKAWWDQYEAIRAGNPNMSKSSAAKITNSKQRPRRMKKSK